MKASQTETVIMLTCCALQSACYSPTGIVISFILAQIQGEVQTNLTVKRFLMCSAALCTSIAERIIYNFAFVALCGALQTHFHRRGRRGKRQLQRRFLRKRGAAGRNPPSDEVLFVDIQPTPCHLSQRERPWQKDEVRVDCQGLPLWGSWQIRRI